MENKDSIDKIALDTLCKEHARVCGAAEKMTHEVYSDFQLIGTTVAFLGWKIYSDRVDNTALELFEGFLVTVSIVGLILFQNLVKMSVLYFNLNEVEHYERSIHDLLGGRFDGTFHLVKHLRHLGQHGSHAKAMRAFGILFSLVTIGWPTLILYRKAQDGLENPLARSYWMIYAAVSVLIICIYVRLRDVVVRPAPRDAK